MKDKVDIVLEGLRSGKTLDEIASSLGYRDKDSLTQLMRRAGYRWDRSRRTYVPVNGEAKDERPAAEAAPTQELSPEARELLDRAAEVLRLLEYFNPNGGMAEALSSPLLRGPEVVKSLRLPHPLVEEVERFARDRFISQKRVFECALVEFLARRGGKGDASTGCA